MSPEKRSAQDTARDLPPVFSQFYEATHVQAFGLATRLTVGEVRARKTCEAAYLELWQQGEAATENGSAAEAWLFDRIRLLALGLDAPMGSQTGHLATGRRIRAWRRPARTCPDWMPQGDEPWSWPILAA